MAFAVVGFVLPDSMCVFPTQRSICGIVVFMFVLATPTFAFLSVPFGSWDKLIEHSPDIIIARCTDTTSHPLHFADDLVPSAIEIISVLKGNTKAGLGVMISQCAPRKGEIFLLFSEFQVKKHDTHYLAYEPYRIVRIDEEFNIKDLDGKPLRNQIEQLLEMRLRAVKEEIEVASRERARLESVPLNPAKKD